MATLGLMSKTRVVRALSSLSLGALVGSIFFFVALPARAALTCGDITDLATVFLQKHVRYHSLTPELRERAIDNYLRRIDPQRVLFLEKEVAGLRGELDRLFAETRAGDCGRLREVHRDLLARHQQVEAFVRAFVEREDPPSS